MRVRRCNSGAECPCGCPTSHLNSDVVCTSTSAWWSFGRHSPESIGLVRGRPSSYWMFFSRYGLDRAWASSKQSQGAAVRQSFLNHAARMSESPQVVIVVPPFANAAYPALGPSVLSAACKEKGMETRVYTQIWNSPPGWISRGIRRPR
jgi:hypothetical protein